MVHCLVGHATCDGPVSDDRHAVVLPSLQEHEQEFVLTLRQQRTTMQLLSKSAGEVMLQGYTLKSRATAIPRAAEMDVEEWPAPKGSYSLSALFVNPAGCHRSEH